MKKTFGATVILCSSMFLILSLQTVAFSLTLLNVEWNQTYGGPYEDMANSLVQTIEGGYALAGRTYPAPIAGYMDAWLIKVDSYGNQQWTQSYGGSQDDAAYSLVQTTDGGYAMAGYTGSFSAGYNDVWLVKTDTNGIMLWSQAYGRSSLDEGRCLIQTNDDGYAIAGFTDSYGAGGHDVYLVKTDADGNMQWNKTYGGPNDDVAWAIVQTDDGGYTLAGYKDSINSAQGDFWLIKTDADGNMIWNKTYGGAGSDHAYSLVKTPEGGYILAGWTDSFGAGSRDSWVVKTDADGNMQWNKTYGGPSADWANSIARTSDGEYVLAGATAPEVLGNSDLWLVKIDSNGNEEWNTTYGKTDDDEEAYSVIQSSDKGYASAGRTYPFGERVHSDALLVKVRACLNASADVKPDVLNLRNKGEMITCYIELPEGYNVADISVSTITLNETLLAESSPATIGDYDKDGITDLMVKFDRADAIGYILEHTSVQGKLLRVTLTLTGCLHDGTAFKASDIITIIFSGPLAK